MSVDRVNGDRHVITDAIWALIPSVAAVFMENQNNVARVNTRFY